MDDKIIKFAKILIENVRDSAIKSCDVQFDTKNLRSPIAKRWNDAKNSGDIDYLGRMIIADCVDDTIFHFLNALDEGLINLTIDSENKTGINLTKDGYGELGGWYMGEWRSKYSNERCFNDLLNTDE